MADLDARATLGPVLVGLRGCGKSSVAPLLASRLEMTAVDADAELEKQQGRTIAEIFAADGEPYFRSLEQKLLLELVERPQIVLATGGGAVLHPDFRGTLVGRFTVWLHAPLALLAQRIKGSSRPNLTEESGLRELELVMAERESFYRSVAIHTISVDQDLAQIVDAMVNHWRSWRNE